MSQIVINIPIVIDTTYPIKSQIDFKWIFTDIIYDRGNIIYIACFDNDCNYVAKKIRINKDYDEIGCFTMADKVRNELVISKLMSDNDIGPKIYDMSINETEAIMIMDKYDGTLDDLLHLYQMDRSIPIDRILNDLENLIYKMHSLNIVHNDLHLRNVLYTKKGKIILADFGQSLYTTFDELKELDRLSFEGIKELYNIIKKSKEIFNNDCFFDWALDLQPRPFVFYDFIYTWNGQECDWYI